MGKKGGSNLLNNLKNRREVTRQGEAPVTELTKEVPVISQGEIIETYESKIDYSMFEIDEAQKQQLKEYERIAVRGAERTAKILIEIGEAFREAQKILSHDKKGGFAGWYEALGFKKDFVYMTLNRYSLYLNQGKSEEVAALPDRVIKAITSKNSTLTENEVKSIIHSEEPMKKLKELKEQKHSVRPNVIKMAEEIEEAVIVEDVTNIESENEERKKALKKEIAELELLLAQKRKELEELESEFSKNLD